MERLQLMALTQMILLCARHVRTHELYNLILLYLLLGTISDLMIAPAHNITIESGTTVSLNCSAKQTSGQDCSKCLVWKHGNVLLSDTNFVSINETLSSTLPLTVDMNNQGEYSCQTNGTMTAMSTASSVYITATSECTSYNFNEITLFLPGVSIKGIYTNIRIGNTVNITCMIVPLPQNTTYEWLSQNESIETSSNVLTLTGNHTIDGSMFTCLVKSPQLYSPIEKTITVTVQGM